MSAIHLLYAFATGLLPSLFWLWFWLREDTAHDEPRKILARCFLGGMLSVIIVGLAEKYVSDIVSDSTTLYIIWAVLEEIIKFAVVYSVALRGKYAYEPIDIMIYCVTVALGFAALENALFILAPISQGDIIGSIHTGDLRFIGAELLHVVSSAMVGFALGCAYYKSIPNKLIAAVIGLIVASALHAAFNLSIINGSMADILKTFVWIWIAVVLIIILFEEIKAVRPHPNPA